MAKARTFTRPKERFLRGKDLMRFEWILANLKCRFTLYVNYLRTSYLQIQEIWRAVIRTESTCRPNIDLTIKHNPIGGHLVGSVMFVPVRSN
jgi:hypothetical protein